jgi:hypothetical protein
VCERTRNCVPRRGTVRKLGACISDGIGRWVFARLLLNFAT